MAWIKSQNILPEFKQAYRTKDFGTCVQLLGGLRKDDIPYFSSVLAESVVEDVRQNRSYTQLYELTSKCGIKVRRRFAGDLLNYYLPVVKALTLEKDSRPFQEVANVVYDVVIPICRDFLNRNITFINNFCGLLSRYQQVGAFNDENVKKWRELMKRPKMQAVARGVRGPVPIFDTNEPIEMNDFIKKVDELKRFLVSPQ